jgi:hypothetical protein
LTGDRHHLVGFDGPLSTLRFRLVLRVLLAHRWSVGTYDVPGTGFPTFAWLAGSFHASSPRVSLGVLVSAWLLRDSFQRPPAPLRRTRHWRQPPPGMPIPGYQRRAPGFSPAPRLTAPNAFRACFIPVTPMGFTPFRAFSLCSAVAPLGARSPPGVCLTSPAPSRSPPGRPTSSCPCGHPCLATREAKRLADADRDVPRTASRARLIPTVPRGTDFPGPMWLE